MLFVLSQPGKTTPLLQGNVTGGTASSPTALTLPSANRATLNVASETAVPETVSYSQMLAAYKDMLTVYKNILETIKWIVVITFVVLTLEGLGAFWLIQRSLRDINKVRDETKKLKDTLNNNQKQIEKMQRNLENIEEEARLIKHDLNIISRLETLAAVDTYAMRLFSNDKKIRQIAKRELIELSKDKDPIVRRRCVCVFGTMLEYPECFDDLKDPRIISRLQEMIINDPERGVHLEAKRVLKKLVERSGSSGRGLP